MLAGIFGYLSAVKKRRALVSAFHIPTAVDYKPDTTYVEKNICNFKKSI